MHTTQLVMRLCILLLVFAPQILSAQIKEHTGWLAFFNSTRFNPKWGMHWDVQLRSSDDFKNLRNLLIRPGLMYHINGKSHATVGYLLNNTYIQNSGAADVTLTEHRVWEQYTYNQKLKATSLAHRFRLEQRFIERPTEDLFSQRLRYFIRSVSPLARQDSSFVRGPFLALQNELFLNLQNRDKLNGHFFDQNRAYIAVGQRFSKKFDAEIGYLNQSVKGAVSNTSNHVIQAVVYTRF